MSLELSSMSMTMSSMMSQMSSSMEEMASSSMDMMHLASSTMDMDMSLETGMHMSGMSMHMAFTTDYKDYPVLFNSLTASNGGEAFGIFVLLFAIGFLSKSLQFAKSYLEQRVWNRPGFPVVIESSSEDEKDVHAAATTQPVKSNFASSLIKDFIRLILIFVPEMFGFALMLAAMTYSLVYFFAVVSGLSFGTLFFEKLGRKYNVCLDEGSSHHA